MMRIELHLVDSMEKRCERIAYEVLEPFTFEDRK
jgi:hypothetical protein